VISLVRSLGYVGLETADLDGWEQYATRVLGTMTAQHSTPEHRFFKIDNHPHRLAVVRGVKDRLAYIGWELKDISDMDRMATLLTNSGFTVTEEATKEELAARQVNGMIWCTDPGGFRVEFYHGRVLDHSRFISPVGVERFVTGDQGLGHIVLLTDSFEESSHFYQEVLGFWIRDYMILNGRPLRFMGCNARHHSIAIGPHHSSRLAHIMLQVPNIDEVGYCLDRCARQGITLTQSLGRHANDKMLSFYMRAPRGYEIEYGADGLEVDDEKWIVSEITKVSDWGHIPI